MPILRSLSPLALLCLIASPALCQQYTVKNIVFDGKTPYSQAALEAASGLKPGSTISKDDLQAASQKLIDTGAFADLSSTLDGPAKAITVIFKVKSQDPARIITASFDNFVWYQPAELAAEIQKTVPLFDGTVPEAGNEQDAIVGAIKQLLTAKGVTGGSISVEPVAPSSSQPLRVLDFRLTKPAVRIHSLKVDGMRPNFASAKDKLVQVLTGKAYNEGLLPKSLQNVLLTVYKNAGFQAAKVSSLTRTIASSSDTTTDVDVAVTIEEGDVYRLSKLDWAGSPMMSTEAFNAEADLHPGDVASQKTLLQSLSKLEAAYRRKGYMDVVVTSTPQLDTTAHTVTFAVAVIPGEVYKLSAVSTVNLNPTQKADFDKAWTLKPGDTYDESYVTGFLKNNSAVRSLEGLSAAFKTVADPDAHTVELILTFAGAGTTPH
jgi:outer membrane protein insertion porin family